MLTGRSAFGADSVIQTLGRVLERAPDWNLLPQVTPEWLRALLGQCLEKPVDHRLPDIATARRQIEASLDEQQQPSSVAARPSDASAVVATPRRGRRATVVGAAVLVLLTAIAAVLFV